MKKIIRRFIAVLYTGIIMCSQGFCVSATEENHVITENITLPSGITVSDLHENLNVDADETDYASASVGIFQGDKVIYTGYFGYIDMENELPTDKDSVYEWGSITKTLIWVSVMQLWEQGRIDLERDVREYLPDGFFRHLSYDEPITMLNLMNHNAGWQETVRSMESKEESKVLPLKEALQAIEPAQVSRPGEVVAYSNYGAGVAGYVVECITGQDFCEYVHENIFEPLGMEHTSLNPVHSDNEWVYQQRKISKSYGFIMGIKAIKETVYISAYPAGAATGTLSDLMLYGQALVNDDAPLFQNPETQQLMFSGTHFYGNSDIPTCTHGFWCNERGVRTYGHSGATRFGQANLEFDFNSKIGLVVMINEYEGNMILSKAPIYTFGELSPDKYAQENTEKTKLDGSYIMSRSTRHGILKASSYLSAIHGSALGETEKIGDSIYQARDEGILDTKTESAILLGVKTDDNGYFSIEQPSVEVIRDDFYFLKLCILVLYFLFAIAAIYMIFIRHKLKKYGKLTAYSGQVFINAGQIAWIISVLLLLSALVCYNKNGGITYGTSAVLGILQIICMAVCVISAATAVFVMIKSRKKMRMAYCAVCIAGNIVLISSVSCFEMYCFWGI